MSAKLKEARKGLVAAEKKLGGAVDKAVQAGEVLEKARDEVVSCRLKLAEAEKEAGCAAPAKEKAPRPKKEKKADEEE